MIIFLRLINNNNSVVLSQWQLLDWLLEGRGARVAVFEIVSLVRIGEEVARRLLDLGRLRLFLHLAEIRQRALLVNAIVSMLLLLLVRKQLLYTRPIRSLITR